MENENIEILSDALKEYLGDYELEELCTRFGLEFGRVGIHPNRKKLVSQLISQKYRDIPVVIKEIGRKWREGKVFLK